MRIIAIVCLAGLGIAGGMPAFSQQTVTACQAQQEIEQVIQSNGQIKPDGCRNLKISRIQVPAGELCLLDFEKRDPGIVGTITQAAAPTQWWIACADMPTR
jgi:hypothetical protein